jgi:hypothetical protein
LSQHHRFRSNYIAAWHAVLIMLALAGGFVVFYVGGKSSDVKTVAIYICLFILANVMKGPVVLRANKPRYSRLNNFGHKLVDGGDEEQSPQAQPQGSPSTSDLNPVFVPSPDIHHSYRD